ncbi:hypothetical protein, partial [Collimonas sp. OK307]|uniref:hypothetical protein n=1 Tax=Collimonas sp. OK307 TaxID=1801620 RepID=UPI001C31A22D
MSYTPTLKTLYLNGLASQLDTYRLHTIQTSTPRGGNFPGRGDYNSLLLRVRQDLGNNTCTNSTATFADR